MGVVVLVLRITGAAYLFLANLGLLIFNANYIVLVRGHWDQLQRSYFPGAPRVIYSASVAIAVLSAFTSLFIFFGFLACLFCFDGGRSIDPICFGVSVILFLGVLIATAIAVNEARFSGTSSDIDAQEAANYNTSKDVSDFVWANRSYVRPAPTPSLPPAFFDLFPDTSPTPPETTCMSNSITISKEYDPWSVLRAYVSYLTHEGTVFDLFYEPGKYTF
jgi:hypothetical protein